jgi:hypothetical protein
MAKAKQVKRDATWRGAPLLMWVIIGLLIAVAVTALVGYKYKNVAVAACSVDNLTLSKGPQEGAAGTIYQHMVLTNTSKQSCTIGGFPTAFLHGSDGYALGTAAASMSDPSPSIITINKNESAYTVLGYPQAGNFDPGICSDKATSLELYIPGATSPLEVPLDMPWCPGFSSTAFKAGS